MISFVSLSMRCDGRRLSILDQTLLPQREIWLACDTADALIGHIQRLAIRGAPAIGVSAAVLLGLLAERGASPRRLAADAGRLRQARPTAVNLMHAIDRLLPEIDAVSYPQTLVAEAERIYREDVEQCERMARYGAALIGRKEKLLTHCNTGGLATAGIGTAFGVIQMAWRQGKQPFVWVDETRPLLQGGRLTAWECLHYGIEHTIICDGAAAHLMRLGDVQHILVGSDRIAVNGDFANKIGTYQLAVAAQYHHIPFYVVAPVTTVDHGCASGAEIPIEQRGVAEIHGVTTATGTCRWAPDQSPALNPAFDVTPARLVTAWILDTGVHVPADLADERWWEKRKGAG